jgi:hypothetical protein
MGDFRNGGQKLSHLFTAIFRYGPDNHGISCKACLPVTDNRAEFPDQAPLHHLSDNMQNFLFRDAGLLGN